jgi:hypothetical protein
MSEASLAVAGVTLRVSRGLADVIGLSLGPGSEIIIPSSVFFPSPAAALSVTQIDLRAFQHTWITSMFIPRHVQILCSECSSDCKSLSLISFETDSELTGIESCAFSCRFLSNQSQSLVMFKFFV